MLRFHILITFLSIYKQKRTNLRGWRGKDEDFCEIRINNPTDIKIQSLCSLFILTCLRSVFWYRSDFREQFWGILLDFPRILH